MGVFQYPDLVNVNIHPVVGKLLLKSSGIALLPFRAGMRFFWGIRSGAFTLPGGFFRAGAFVLFLGLKFREHFIAIILF
jgi:hypothetical protein